MKSEVVQKISLSEDEEAIIGKAIGIISAMSIQLMESYFLDDQIIPDCINNLTQKVVLMEEKRPYSIFNILTDDARSRLIREAVNMKGENE